MPPWHADSRYGEFLNDRRLSLQEIETIVTWVAHGAKEGNPEDLPPLPRYFAGWKIGKPDYVLAMSEDYTIEAHAPDSYVYVTFPTRFKEDRWVRQRRFFRAIRESSRKQVRWGDPSYDEMMIGWLEYVVPNIKQQPQPSSKSP
jgi:hypothetical protein